MNKEDFEKTINWPENNKRFVIIEKYEENSYKIRMDNGNNVEYIRFVDADSKTHRNNSNPSFISEDSMMWHRHGLLHRTNDRPAIIRDVEKEHIHYHWNTIQNTNIVMGQHKNNHYPIEEYFVNGERHRENDLPAIIFKSSKTHLSWYKNGQLHRDDNNPAKINGDFKFYYKEGELLKSKIDYNNKLANWIVEHPFLLTLGFTALFSIITFFA